MTGRWLVVVDIPDERFIRMRSGRDHMHRWFDDLARADLATEMLFELFGNTHHHELVAPPGVCPRCGEKDRSF